MTTETAPSSNFLRSIIENDLQSGHLESRRWGPPPATAQARLAAPVDTARIRTRFPPEPNGYLHIGHAKSICLNFGLAKDYDGICHLRFDDTNPEKEEDEYVRAIIDMVQWLGFEWSVGGVEHCYYASDYFEAMYGFAEALVQAGHAYVDEQSAEQMRATRGTLTEAGTDSPWRDRPAHESLRLLREMRAGVHPDGRMALRARIDMASPNINLRDPVLYRIRHAEHHRTGNTWCIYPMYSWAHPVEDALEGITHSICTLEFEDQRPFYDWILQRLAELGQLAAPLPRQYEFARLNLEYVVTSKRKLRELVLEGHVNGWDDPRLPTLAGLRRRGYTPASIRLFCDRLGVSKADSRIEYSVLEQALRDDLDPIADRAVAILDPLRLVITNFPDARIETCSAPLNPHAPDGPRRRFPFTRTLYIERDDFREDPPRKYFRLFPGNLVRLKYAWVIRCTGFTRNEDGDITEVQAEYLPDTRSGTQGADAIKVKGTITWISAVHAIAAEFRLYDRLFLDAHPDSGQRDFLQLINPESCRTVQGLLEPGVRAVPGATWQFERLGYFVADRELSTPERPVLNRSVTLRDTWART
ncbi:glutamine--tRNA ligase/YqeY domain fusion protein [Castellaniella sp.]|uniref:glutamine--tRNA ligase/YqeY domain fusion protein n=1 Tax=Castellaniella sp. TaxID=1955812 RepID=UPI00355DB6DB